MGSATLHLVTEEAVPEEGNKCVDMFHYMPYDKSPSRRDRAN